MLRRFALRSLGLLLLLAGPLGAGPLQAGPVEEDGDRLALHVLNRLAFGPSAADLAAIREQGIDSWILHQLDPGSIPEPAALTRRLDGLETTRLDASELFAEYGPERPLFGRPDPDSVKAARERARVILQQAADARLARAIYGSRQLEEVMVDFWYNHFNVFAQKGLDHLWVGDYENRAIRPYALGRFRDLLEATARHPAMLFYLDNAANGAGHLNENYARELMELHTVGVDGGYGQADVEALARILTGWGISRPGFWHRAGTFRFEPGRHDWGEKTFLGHTIQGTGADEIRQALDLLADSPATARHISFQLAQYFLADQPPPSLVARLAVRWQETGGDIREVLKALFFSPEFRDPANFGAKFKTPYQFVISSARASGLAFETFKPLLGTMARLGEPLYGCLTPDGYKNTRAAWLSSDAMNMRLSFATALGSGRLPGETAAPDMGALTDLLDPLLSSRTRETAAVAPPPLRPALVIGSPDFMVR